MTSGVLSCGFLEETDEVGERADNGADRTTRAIRTTSRNVPALWQRQTPPIWPIPAELLTWFGDVNISCDPQDWTLVTAVNANAVVHGYSQWYSSHEQASKRIVELEKEISGADVD